MRQLKSFIGNPKNISLDDICKLLSITTTQDELGQFIKSETPHTAFCSKLSITRAEFNSSGQLGHKPEIMIVIDSDTYNNESYLEYENKKYSIYKTFQRADNYTELYCEVKNDDRR